METIAQLFCGAVVIGLKTETKTRVWGHHSGFQLKRHREKRTEHLFQSSISYIIDIWLILTLNCILPKNFSLISRFAHADFFLQVNSTVFLKIIHPDDINIGNRWRMSWSWTFIVQHCAEESCTSRQFAARWLSLTSRTVSGRLIRACYNEAQVGVRAYSSVVCVWTTFNPWHVFTLSSWPRPEPVGETLPNDFGSTKRSEASLRLNGNT